MEDKTDKSKFELMKEALDTLSNKVQKIVNDRTPQQATEQRATTSGVQPA